MHHEQSDELILLSISISICGFGVLTNTASLIYFFKKGKKSLGDKIITLLNSVDLLLCISAALLSSSLLSAYLKWLFYIFQLAYLCVVDGTSYTTCLLSVTRAIGIASPFYKIRGKLLIAVGVTLFVVMELAASIVPVYTGAIQNDTAAKGRIVITVILMLVVFCATVVSVYKLMKKNTVQEGREGAARNNKKASWTVVILSTLFIVFNSIYIGTTAYILSAGAIGVYVVSIWFRSGTLIAIPLNSAINPIVYIVRRSDMRDFFKLMIQKLCCLS